MNTLTNPELTPAATVRAAWESYKSALAGYFESLRAINTSFAHAFPERNAVDIAGT